MADDGVTLLKAAQAELEQIEKTLTRVVDKVGKVRLTALSMPNFGVMQLENIKSQVALQRQMLGRIVFELGRSAQVDDLPRRPR